MSRKIEIKQNFLDRTIAYVAPGYAAKRFQARGYMAIAGGYTGARKDRRQTSSWNPSGGDANAELSGDLLELRERSRDLIRNNPIGRGAINTVTTNVVGNGLRLNSQIDNEFLGLSEDEAREWEAAAERLFDIFTTECDFAEELTFGEMQELVFRSALESGDSFIIRRMNSNVEPGGLFKTRLQVLEADRVSNPDRKSDSATLSGGIEIDSKSGKVLQYHISDTHPGNVWKKSLKWASIPPKVKGVRVILHMYQRLRPGQTRGEPYLAPVIETLKQIDRYTEAELMAAVVSGMLSVFVKTEGAQGLAATEPTAETGSQPSDKDFKMASGMVVDLAPGEDIEVVNPGRPNPAFDPFMTAIVRQIGIALEIPFEVLTKHFTASFSASRAALEMAWQFFSKRRFWLANRFCQPTYEWVIDEAVASGLLPAPGFFDNPLIRRAYLGAEWVGPARISLDPVKDANSDEKYLALGVKTLKDVTVERTGGDWVRKTNQRAQEVSKRRDLGLVDTTQAQSQEIEQEETEE